MWGKITFAEYTDAFHTGFECTGNGSLLSGGEYWEYHCKDGHDYRTETDKEGNSTQFRFKPSI